MRLSIILGCAIDELLEIEGKENNRYNYSIQDSLTESEISSYLIRSEKYHAAGRFIFRDKACFILLTYGEHICETGFAVSFRRDLMPWIIEAGKMKIESFIEEMEFQALSKSLMGEDFDVWE